MVNKFRIGLLFLCSGALLIASVPCGYAVPATAQLNDARNQASDARKKLDDISVKLELATEDYEEVASTLKATNAEIFDANVALKKANEDLADAQLKLNKRAASMYRSDSLSIVDVVLGAENFNDLVSRLDIMQRLSQQDNELLMQVRGAKADIESAKATLETKRAKQAESQRELARKKSQAEALYAEQNSYLQSLNGKIKDLIDKQREQIAAEEKRKEEEAARAAAAQQSQNDGSSNSSSSGAVTGARNFSESALGGAHPKVVSYAMKYVGKTPYVWGGTSPSGFDCSGLTQYCYRKAGISIPRTSRTQYQIGAYIPASRKDLLKEGDLLFFGYGRSASRIHHVAIYAGGGRMIHAPQTGMKVSVTYLSSRSDYVGAVRP